MASCDAIPPTTALLAPVAAPATSSSGPPACVAVVELDAAADALDFDFRGAGFQTTDSKFVGYGFERWRLD